MSEAFICRRGGSGGAALNIDFGANPPSDTSKLWIPLDSKPSKIKADTVLEYGDNLHEEITMINDVPTNKVSESYVKAIKNGRTSTGYYADGKYIYCIGTRKTPLLRYNMETNTMEFVASCPISVEMTGIAVSDGIAYINGGINASDNVWYNSAIKIDVSSGQATQLGGSSNLARSNVGWMHSVMIGKKIYQFGGGYSATNGSSNYKSVWMYDIDLDSKTAGTNLPQYSNYMAAVPVGNVVYLFGGRKSTSSDSSGSSSTEIVKYNTTDNTVTVLSAALPKAGYGLSAQLFAGKIYIISANPSKTSTTYNYLCIFDPATETIQNVGQVTNKEFYGLGACGAYGDSIFFISNNSGDTVILKITPKTILEKDVLFIQEAFIPKNKVVIVKSKDTEVMCDVESVWLGNDEGYADRQNAYIYNEATSQWELVDGVSVTADALNALNILGVN